MIRKHLLISTALPFVLALGVVPSLAISPLSFEAPRQSMVLRVQMSVDDATAAVVAESAPL